MAPLLLAFTGSGHLLMLFISVQAGCTTSCCKSICVLAAFPTLPTTRRPLAHGCCPHLAWPLPRTLPQLRGGLPGSVLPQKVPRQLLAAGLLRGLIRGAVHPDDGCGPPVLPCAAVGAGAQSVGADQRGCWRSMRCSAHMYCTLLLLGNGSCRLPPWHLHQATQCPHPTHSIDPPTPQWWPRCGRRTRL